MAALMQTSLREYLSSMENMNMQIEQVYFKSQHINKRISNRTEFLKLSSLQLKNTLISPNLIRCIAY